jgi:hypothetical protein
MRLSFYDENSMEEAVESLRFRSSHNENSVSETGHVDVVDQEGLDHIDIQQGDDIEIVDR